MTLHLEGLIANCSNSIPEKFLLIIIYRCLWLKVEWQISKGIVGTASCIFKDLSEVFRDSPIAIIVIESISLSFGQFELSKA